MDRQQTERPSCKYFRHGSVDNLIYKLPKPPKDNKKRQKNVRFNERGNRESQNNLRTVITITIKIYMHIWHVCLVMAKVLVEILVIV